MRIASIIMVLSGFLFSVYTIHINDIKVPLIEEGVNKGEEIEKPTEKNKIALIVEVKGDPKQHQQYIEDYLPSIEVVATYSTLFNGLALKGPPKKMSKLAGLQFIKGIHPVHTYEILQGKFDAPISHIHDSDVQPNIFVPSQFNQTPYTGKGVKVGVVDTGIDMAHPDLIANYRGGFDLVDLDNDPMETTKKQGIPTSHGTHVAGIIGANGSLKGVAPHSDIYAYRALGPGGMGTSIQVIAAMEEAVNDGVDIINLSLGNTVNGPDYPTSKAVNEATKQGVSVVVANGNAGPLNWTVGAPATANKAIAVGALEPEATKPLLYEPISKKKIPLAPLKTAQAWNLIKDFEITTSFKEDNVRGKIVLMEEDTNKILDKMIKIEENGGVAVILYAREPANREWMAQLAKLHIKIPIALISTTDANWVKNHIKDQSIYFKNKKEDKNQNVAKFSSRGPVTENWALKPDLIAPGVNILSTVPGGYDILNGTSMAAPHITGALAVMKEAKPSWSNDKILGALRTTAEQITDSEGKTIEPIEQGAGLAQISKAIQAETILYNPLLSFGKVNQHIGTKVIDVTIENTTNHQKHYYFTIPKKERGVTWKLPMEFSLEPNEKKTIPIELKINSLQLADGLHQGWLILQNEKNKFNLPYLFINKTANNPKIMGFTFELNTFHKDVYNYELYVAEPVKSVQIELYDPDTLVYEGTLWKWDNLEVGMNEGEILRRRVEKKGYFYGLIIAQLENGEFVNYETEILLE